MIRKLLPSTACLMFITVLLLAISACGGDEQTGLPTPKVQVYVTKATDVPIFREFVGETLGDTNVDIAARVQGFLEARHFEEGSFVKEGQLLYTIESQPFEEKVAQAQSELATAQVNLANAESDLSRIKPLAAENAISQIDLDAAQARYEASIEAVKAAEAGLRAANLELSYTKVYSPINGVIGKSRASEGDFVGGSPSTVVLTTISFIDTMAVQFYLTQNEYLEAAKRFEQETGIPEPSEEEKQKEDLSSYCQTVRYILTKESSISSTETLIPIRAQFLSRPSSQTLSSSSVRGSSPVYERKWTQ